MYMCTFLSLSLYIHTCVTRKEKHAFFLSLSLLFFIVANEAVIDTLRSATRCDTLQRTHTPQLLSIVKHTDNDIMETHCNTPQHTHTPEFFFIIKYIDQDII